MLRAACPLCCCGANRAVRAFHAPSLRQACARTDRPDGLYSTVVTDENGVALGLVYSSADSIAAAITSGRGVYYSRSRGGLWRKGDTSGAWQDLQHVDVDCDNDALLFSVIQRGEPPAFCHTGTRTCWGHAGGLSELEQTLRSRLSTAPEGSYTKRLFKDPVLLRRKLLEEANELAEVCTKVLPYVSHRQWRCVCAWVCVCVCAPCCVRVVWHAINGMGCAAPCEGTCAPLACRLRGVSACATVTARPSNEGVLACDVYRTSGGNAGSCSSRGC